MASALDYVTLKNPGNAPKYTAPKKTVAPYTPGTYQSQYTDQLSNALNTVTNWSYNPMQDASYQALAKVYGARGNIAAKNTLADAAALNGGYGTSYAVSAAQQARNQYNQELAAMIPELENAAYNRATGTLNALRDADNTDYGRFRDTEQDRQWKYQQDYQAWRDATSDAQWLYGQNYQMYRDLMADYQWGRNYNLDIYNLRQAAASSSGGGGGGGGGGGRRRRRGGGGGGGSYGGSSGSSGSAYSNTGSLLSVNGTSGGSKTITAPFSGGGTAANNYSLKRLKAKLAKK